MKESSSSSFFYFIVSFGIFYHFFINTSFHYFFPEKNLIKRVQNNFEIPDKKLIFRSSVLKKKLLIDFLYRSRNEKSLLQVDNVISVSVDREGKIIGYKKFFYENSTHKKLPLPGYISKKFLHSTLFGSIKLREI